MIKTFISFKLGEDIPEPKTEEAVEIGKEYIGLTYEEGSTGIKILAYGETKEKIKNLIKLTVEPILEKLKDYYFFGKTWEEGKEKGEFTVKKNEY